MEMKDWCLGVGESGLDFLITWDTVFPPLFKQDETRYEYSQGGSLDCTLYGSFGALSDLMNYKFSTAEIKEIVAKSYEMGRTEWKWWFTRSGVSCVCKRWNKKFPDNPVAYYRMDITWQNMLSALSNNYTVTTTYRGNGAYGRDIYDNAELNNDDCGDPKTYGHCNSFIWEEGCSVKDSYRWRKWKDWIPTNIYKVVASIKWLVDNSVYYGNCYVIVKVKNIDRVEELKRLAAFKLRIEQNIENNSAMRHETNEERFKDRLHECNNILRDKLSDIADEFTKLG